MNPTQVGRLLWKEYRAQRGLWLGFVGIVLVVQLLVWGLMPPNERTPLASLMLIGMILSGFYALGSAAVLFAGEREEGTDTWLRVLPVGSGSVVVGKIAWMVLSWIAAGCVAVVFAVLLTQSHPGAFRLRDLQLFQFTQSAAAMLLWGLFCSLLCRRVYVALALSAAAMLVSFGINSWAPGFIYGVFAALVVGNAVAGRRWLRSAGETAFDRLGEGLSGFTLSAALDRAVDSSPAWRFFRRELWLEWRQARWWMLGYLCIAATVIVSGQITRYPDWPKITWLIIFGGTALWCGVSTFRAEQFRERYRFQANQGAGPFAVWLSKQIVWLGLMFAGSALLLLFLMPQLLHGWNTANGSSDVYLLLPIPESFVPSTVLEKFMVSPGDLVGVSISFSLLVYWMAQVCSLLFRRSVTAAAIAGVGTCWMAGWMMDAVVLDVPAAISVMVPCLLMIGFSVWRTQGWLTERNFARDWLRVGSIALLLAACAVSSWVVWRLLEPEVTGAVAGGAALFTGPAAIVFAIAVGVTAQPLVTGVVLLGGVVLLRLWLKSPARRFRFTAGRMVVGYLVLHAAAGVTFATLAIDHQNAVTENTLSENVPKMIPSEAALETGDMYRRADELLTESIPVAEHYQESGGKWYEQDFATWDNVTAEQKRWLAENQESLEVLLAATARASCAPANYFDERNYEDSKELNYEWRGCCQLLRLKALEFESKGDLAGAWAYHRAGLRMMVHHTQGQTFSWRRSSALQIGSMLQLEWDIPRWAARREQTQELLQSASFSLLEELIAIEPLRETFRRRGIHGLWALHGDYYNAWSGKGGMESLEGMHNAYTQLLHAVPWEGARAERVVADVTKHNAWMAEAVVQGNQNVYSPELRGYNYTIPGVTPSWLLWTNRRDPYARLWHVADVTPLPESVWAGTKRDMGGPAYEIVAELQFIRARRLTFLTFAGYAMRLATGELPEDLEALRENDAAKRILVRGEEAEVEYALIGDQRDRFIRADLLYFDPMGLRRFELRLRSEQVRLRQGAEYQLPSEQTAP